MVPLRSPRILHSVHSGPTAHADLCCQHGLHGGREKVEGGLHLLIGKSSTSPMAKLSLSQVFRLAGRVVGVELQRDKEGKSRGFAVVVYDHPVEAVQAISMLNNQQLFDR